MKNHNIMRSGLMGLTMLFATIIAAGIARAADTAEEAANRQFISDAFSKWAAGGTSFFTDVLSPDIVWTIEGSGPSAGVFRGRQAFIGMVQPSASRLSDPVKPVATRVWADGDHVIVNWEGAGTARDGAPYANRYVWIFRMSGGQAVEVTAFLDLVPFDDVLRRVPAPVQR
jgi:uncharacterized protein